MSSIGFEFGAWTDSLLPDDEEFFGTPPYAFACRVERAGRAFLTG